jgi:hypothetical protein
MKPMRPFRIDVFNIADQTTVGQYYAAQVPQVGELVKFFGRNSNREREGDAFHGWFLWKVDQVVWNVASAGSRTAMDLAREIDAPPDDSGFCEWVEVLVYPAQGPHFTDTPTWAKVAAPVYHADDDEDNESEATDG